MMSGMRRWSRRLRTRKLLGFLLIFFDHQNNLRNQGKRNEEFNRLD